MRMPVTGGGGRFPRRFRRSRARWLLALRHAARNTAPAGGGSGFTSGTGAVLRLVTSGEQHDQPIPVSASGEGVSDGGQLLFCQLAGGCQLGCDPGEHGRRRQPLLTLVVAEAEALEVLVDDAGEFLVPLTAVRPGHCLCLA